MDEIQRDPIPVQANTTVPTLYTCFLVAMTFILPGTMMIMCISSLVFFDMEHQSYSSLDWYEVILLVLSLVALAYIWKESPRSTEMADTQTQRFVKICKSRCGFIGLVSCLALMGLLTPVFKTVAIASCFRTDADTAAVLRFSLNVFQCIFLIGQTLVFLFAKDRVCTTKRTMWSVMILVSMNASLCVRCLADAVQQTMINNKKNTVEAAYGSAFCRNQSDAVTSGFRVVDKYFYTFVLLYCLYSVEIMCTKWHIPSRQNISMQIEDYPGGSNVAINDNAMARSEVLDEHTSLLRSNSRESAWTRVKSIYCVGVCRYSFIPTSVVCLVILLSHTILDIEMKEFNSPQNGTKYDKDIAFGWIQTMYENIMTGAAFFGLLFVFKENLNPNKLYAKHILLTGATCGLAILISLESYDAVGNISRHPRTEDICLFLFRTVFHLLGLLFQTPFVIKASDLPNLQVNSNRYVYVRGILWFLAITNLERSLVDTFLTPIVLRYALNVPNDYFGVDNWAIATRLLFPVVAFYRLQTSLLCLDNLRNLELRRRQMQNDNA